MKYEDPLRRIRDVDGERFFRGIDKMMESEEEKRPSFSHSWLDEQVPSDSERLLEYNVKNSTVRLYRLKDETEDLYHLVPSEYSMEEKEAYLLNMIKKHIAETYPRNADFSSTDMVKEYLLNTGRSIIESTATKESIKLGDSREEELKNIDELSSLLVKYTVGYGVLETLFKDPNVQDIYINAPSEQNPVYVELSGIPDIRERCRTNIYVSIDGVDGLLSRMRSESGEPFSEAFPVLEMDLSEFNSRATAIGPPLSPDGIALAFRRRDSEPWTLPRLISVGSLTPLAAGLLSFLVDGRSTILVAGSRGAGKTSLLGALMMEFPRSQRVLTIEDTRELPSESMQEAGYNIQSMTVSSFLDEDDLSADDALRVSLRLGESSLVLGEVRGQEARTLYEAMRAGTAGSAVMGTIHGDSPRSVYERVVHDMGISEKSFAATDIVVIAGLVRPGGTQTRKRRVTHISEYDEGEFSNLMEYSSELEPTDVLMKQSEKVGAIARSWGMRYEEAIQNIGVRAHMRKMMVEKAEEKGKHLLRPEWVSEANSVFWNLIEEHQGTGSLAGVKKDWTEWFLKRVKHV